MRSNKQRSRSKQNRNRSTVGNVVNRVFDSSGPEGKVRGTPQQIIDKYNQLARDAQLSGDRVATENFQQHSEHYTRMLAEATREQEERREQQEAQQRERQQNYQDNRQDSNRQDSNRQDSGQRDGGQRDGNRQDNRQDRGGQTGREQPRGGGDQPDISQELPAFLQQKPAAKAGKDNDVIDVETEADTGLVETPESKPAPKPRARRPRKPKTDAAAESGTPPTDTPDAAE